MALSFRESPVVRLAAITGVTWYLGGIAVLMGTVLPVLVWAFLSSTWIVPAFFLGFIGGGALPGFVLWPLAWRRSADRLDATLGESAHPWDLPEMEVTVAGRNGTVSRAVTRSRRGGSSVHTDLTVSLDTENADDFTIAPADGRSGVVSVGDPRFDEAFDSYARDGPEFLERVLTPELREELLAMDLGGKITLEPGALRLHVRRRLVVDPEEIQHRLDVLARLADSVERVSGS